MENNIFQSIFKVTHSGGSGSCFYLKSRDLFVTNYHVVEGYRTVAIHDNDRNPYLAHVVVVNPLLDIALLAAEGLHFCLFVSGRSQCHQRHRETECSFHGASFRYG